MTSPTRAQTAGPADSVLLLPRRLGHVPALDGIRAVAILAVVGYHAYGWPREGVDGVGLFFVLSGFLISTLLLEEHADNGRISLGAFYVRRARRLFPALAAMLVGFVAIAAVQGQTQLALRSVAEGGLYTENAVMAFFHGTTGYLNPVEPLWSLAQEEQFYLLWPLLLILALSRGLRLASLERLLCIVVVGLLIEVAILAVTAPWWRIYYAPDTRSIEILVGILAALSVARGATVAEPLLAPIGLGMFIAVAISFPRGAAGFPFSVLPVAVGSMLLVTGVVLSPTAPVARLLAARPLVFLGRVSYSLYLWNSLILWAFDGRRATVALLLAFVVASASHRFIEQPFRRRRRIPAAYEPVPTA